MSLISVIATNKFISITGDTRAVSANNDTEIISEEIRKVFKVNSKVIVAFAGSTVLIDILMPEIENFDVVNAENLSIELLDVLGHNKVNKTFNIFIGGLNTNGDIYYTGFDQSSTELITIVPKPGEARCGTTINQYTENINPTEFLQGMISDYYLKDQSFNLSDAIQVQDEFNSKIADVYDHTVNKRTITEYITL